MLRVGDKVIQTVNDYDKEVFNGDVGQIKQFDIHEPDARQWRLMIAWSLRLV